MRVFLTVDTETSPQAPDWRLSRLGDDMARDIYGETSAGRYGVPYQLSVLRTYGLKAVYLVETLFADAVGSDRLREVAQLIAAGGQEVQLHLHPEWLARSDAPVIRRRAADMHAFLPAEQQRLIERGCDLLVCAGAPRPIAFRAGNYGADAATLAAAGAAGLRFDTSHNRAYRTTSSRLASTHPLVQPGFVNGVCEVPISTFEDWPGHVRHAQLCACSYRELTHALLQAARAGWRSFVIVMHSFELLADRKRPGRTVSPDPVVIRRFERLCRFLAAHRDDMPTANFAEIAPVTLVGAGDDHTPLRSPLVYTAGRWLEQFARRVR